MPVRQTNRHSPPGDPASGKRGPAGAGEPLFARRLRREVEGELFFDPFSRGRYATDASIYQIEPLGVVVPRHQGDVERTLAIAREEGVPVLPRGGGTSQCGQTVGAALILDLSKYLREIISIDADRQRARVQPGIVLDHLNQTLRPLGLWFPVDVSTASRATIGGMTANNSCGSRSLRYGTMRDNVETISAILADGAAMNFGPLASGEVRQNLPSSQNDLIRDLIALAEREAEEIAQRFPRLMRRVGGYNLDALLPAAAELSGEMARRPGDPPNLAHLLVGSEATLAYFSEIELRLAPLARNKVLGVCHFPDFYSAMEAPQHIVKLAPTAVELVDARMIALSRALPEFRDLIGQFVRGQPGALLLVEFAEEAQAENLRRLDQLNELMGDLGHPEAVVRAVDPGFQSLIWEVRKQGLNIMMSMKGDGKPVSFVEDCAVRLEDLPEYTRRLTEIFKKHGTSGTWYAHASVGCLHVRPILNMKTAAGARQMRAIAEEAFELVQAYEASHSGEHGDGLIRSEAHRRMFGERLVEAFGEVKRRLDPHGHFNPGKIVDPPKMDDRRLFRYAPGYRPLPLDTALDWSAWGGFTAAVEMCNNNGACRKFDAGVMCPSYRVTRDEQHLVRGRANSLRLALTGQLGPDALTSDAMLETLSLCVSCKGCKRECPTGVDMARMKIEVLHQRARAKGVPLRERLIAHLPRYAPWLARAPWLGGLRDLLPGAPWLSERLLGLAASRPLPRWSSRAFLPREEALGPEGGRPVVLLPDSFNRWFEPENLRAACDVLIAAGCRVHLPGPRDGGRPLCCGRTYLAAGMLEQARHEQRRTLAALQPFLERDLPVVGLEPSCLLTFRDEALALLPGPDTEQLSHRAFLFEEYLSSELTAGRLTLPLKAIGRHRALLHGHCHQKAFDAFTPLQALLERIPELEVQVIESSCCGMAGAFGYQAETQATSRAMAEADLLPALRQAEEEALVVADGTSCRQQIAFGSGHRALHAARVLQRAL